MKIYIAGKVTGLKKYKKYFTKAEKKLIKKGHLCMNPAVLPKGFNWSDYMKICYSMIDVCDGIFLLKNWVYSDGAKKEYAYAKTLGKKIFFDE